MLIGKERETFIVKTKKKKNMHPLWILCVITRLGLVVATVAVFGTNSFPVAKSLFAGFLLVVSLGFFFKAVTGSNNEKQIAQVFWHETRLVHAVLFGLAAFYLVFNENPRIGATLLLLDLLFSFIYRGCVGG